MTRYSELYRAEQDEKEKLFRELSNQIENLMKEVSYLRAFIWANNLQGQLAEWALSRPMSGEQI